MVLFLKTDGMMQCDANQGSHRAQAHIFVLFVWCILSMMAQSDKLLEERVSKRNDIYESQKLPQTHQYYEVFFSYRFALCSNFFISEAVSEKESSAAGFLKKRATRNPFLIFPCSFENTA